MEPLPETADALRELARRGETSFGVELYSMAARVHALVPDLVGLSLAAVDGGLTLTLVASTEEVAALDAVQYLDGGPCEASVEGATPLETETADVLDEGRWRLFARASAAFGVRSTFSLPMMDQGRVVAGVNLYAAGSSSFAGKHEAIAAAVGSDARLAVTNADLSFRTAERAKEAPVRLGEEADINIALGIICVSQGVELPIASERLRNAAARAGITVAQAARAIKHVRHA